MDLKNITPFNEFRRITEANVPSEFSNNTGFKESLVGRAVFGILRYFQKGINLGRLEFYKRKLENEYFAGLLRFCAVKDINLLTGLEPTGSTNSSTSNTTGGGGGMTSNPDEEDYCKALNFDHVNDPNGNLLTGVQSGFTDLMHILTPLATGDPADPDVKVAMDALEQVNKVIECCNAKWEAVERFLDLQKLSGSTDAQVVALLDEIKKFFDSPVAKYCSTYHGTDEEKNLIRSFANSTNIDIKNKVAEIEPLILDSYKYRGYDLIEEKITSGLNKYVGITQMLGDQLTSAGGSGSTIPSMKVNIYTWLKEQGIDDVNKINFVALENLFRLKGGNDDKYRKDASEYVNIDGIKKIQYAVARIVYQVKKTPDNVGINPGAGGGITEEDSSLRTSWEKRVEFCRSEFSNFLDVNKLDPFKIMSLQDAWRKKSDYANDSGVRNMRVQTNVLINSLTIGTKAVQMGLRSKGNETNMMEGRLYVYTMSFNSLNGGPFYPVFVLKKMGSNVVYRYVGCINFTKIIADKAFDDPNWANNAKNYGASIWGAPGTSFDNTFVNLLKIRPVPAINGYKFDSIYLTTSNYDNIYSYKDNPQDKNIRLLYTFVADGQITGNFQGANGGADNFKLKYLSSVPPTLIEVPVANFGDIKSFVSGNKMYNGHFGEVYEIDTNWYEKYFTSSNGVLISKYISQNKYINDTPYNTKIILKP